MVTELSRIDADCKKQRSDLHMTMIICFKDFGVPIDIIYDV